MKKNNVKGIILFLCSVTLLCSCRQNEELSPTEDLPDVQVFITSFDVASKKLVQNKTLPVENISFRDSISGQSFSYSIYATSDNEYSVDIDADDIIDMHITIEGDILKAEMNDCTEFVRINQERENGYWIYNLNVIHQQASRVSYKHISWFDCVKRLSFNSDVAFGTSIVSSVTKYAFPYVAGAAAVVCLDDRNRWEVN